MGRRDEKRRASPRAPAASAEPLKAGAWGLLMHPLLLDQIERLTTAAEQERAKAPDAEPGPNAKLLGHLLDLMFTKIPQRPGDAIYRGGKALLDGWFRAKTGNGRYRLFYRFDSKTRLIVYAWLNDEHSLRTYGSNTDAYAVFGRMVRDGNPPKDWAELCAAAEERRPVERARSLAAYHEHRDL